MAAVQLGDAIVRGDLSLVQSLVDSGFSIHAECPVTPRLGKTKGNEECLNLVDGHPQTPIILAVCLGRLEIVDYLIKRGANLDRRDSKGCSALHHACITSRHEKQQDVVSLLLRRGASVNAVSNDSTTPLIELFFRHMFHGFWQGDTAVFKVNSWVF